MKICRLLVLGLLILVVSGCASVKVRTDFDPACDFNSFKTYRWATDEEMNPDDALLKSPLVRKRFVDSVDKVMEGKGFTKVVSGDADLVVVMHAGSKEKVSVSHTNIGMGPGPAYRGRYYRGWYDPWWGAYGGMTTVSYYTEGTLVVDMVSWDTKDLVWRGMGTKTVREYKDIEKQKAAFDKIIADILAGFPPA